MSTAEKEGWLRSVKMYLASVNGDYNRCAQEVV
jgi:hypothetical protein